MLHSKKSLAEAVTAMLAGERAPESELERFALLRAMAAGAKPAMTLNVREAIARSLHSALMAQSLELAPEFVKASPALSAQWLRVAAAQIRELPEAKNASAGKAPQAPVVDAAAAADELEQLERAVLLESPYQANAIAKHAEAVKELEARIEAEKQRPWLQRSAGLEQQLAELRQQSPVEARRAELERKVACGNYGRLGRLLCSLEPAARARAQLVDRAHSTRCFGKLGLLVHRRFGQGQREAFETAQPLSAQPPKQTHAHAQAVVEGAKLVWLCTTKTGDAPPPELVEGLGKWEWVEVAERAHGAYLFVAASESKAAAE